MILWAASNARYTVQASKKAKKIPSLSKQALEPKTTLSSQAPRSAATAETHMRKRKAQETAPEPFKSTSEAVPKEAKKAEKAPLHEHKPSVTRKAAALADALRAAKHPATAAAMRSTDGKQIAKGSQAPAPSKSSDRGKRAAITTADATPALQQVAGQPAPAAAAQASRQDSRRHTKNGREAACKRTTWEKHASQGAADASASHLLPEQSIDGSGTADREVAHMASGGSDAENVSDDADLSADVEAGTAHKSGSAADGGADTGARSGFSVPYLWGICLRQ